MLVDIKPFFTNAQRLMKQKNSRLTSQSGSSQTGFYLLFFLKNCLSSKSILELSVFVYFNIFMSKFIIKMTKRNIACIYMGKSHCLRVTSISTSKGVIKKIMREGVTVYQILRDVIYG